jgi:hypothetical protein
MTRSKHSALRPNIRLSMFDFEEREPMSSICFAQSLRIELAIEPPPTFPFLESQCQRAHFGVNFHHARKTTPPARSSPTGGVGAVYRRAVSPCQMRNFEFFAFFREASDRLCRLGVRRREHSSPCGAQRGSFKPRESGNFTKPYGCAAVWGNAFSPCGWGEAAPGN